MKQLLILIWAMPLLWGATLLKTDVVRTSQGEGVTLTLDAPFDGAIDETLTAEGRQITVTNLQVQSGEEITLNGPISKVRIMPGEEGSAVLTFIGPDETKIVASKSTDGYMLRFLIAPLATTTKLSQPAPKPAATPGTTSSGLDIEFGWRYGAVVVLLGVMILLMLWLRRRSEGGGGGWLMPAKEKVRFEILYQKPLDQRNKVVLFNFNGNRYLVLTGSNNVLLDKSTIGRAIEAKGSGNDFEMLLRQNEDRLTQLLENRDGGFDRYKRNAEEQLINL
ncbi:MAG: hypothetical protein K6347_00270 [Campylobacterales bacterium]